MAAGQGDSNVHSVPGVHKPNDRAKLLKRRANDSWIGHAERSPCTKATPEQPNSIVLNTYAINSIKDTNGTESKEANNQGNQLGPE